MRRTLQQTRERSKRSSQYSSVFLHMYNPILMSKYKRLVNIKGFTFLSDKGPTLETLDIAFRISLVHQPFLYFDLFFKANSFPKFHPVFF